MNFESIDKFYEYAKTQLPTSDEDANNRFNEYKSTDPYKKITSALLNSIDIFKYVAATGMIYPFDPKKLKGASYAARLIGECIYWENESMNSFTITEENSLVLRPNSIAFVTIEPQFRIPDYIALRFNLKIDHVYKGLLLGTGPLVDPGFEGRLSIPLHNFTLNEYTLRGGQDIICIEFTKLSSNERWLNSPDESAEPETEGYYCEFPENKKRKPLFKYIEDALHDVGITNINVQNAIPKQLKAFDKLDKSVKEQILKLDCTAMDLKTSIDKRERRITIGVVISLIATLLAIFAMVMTFFWYISNSRDRVLDQLNIMQREQDKKNMQYEKMIKELEDKFRTIKNK